MTERIRTRRVLSVQRAAGGGSMTCLLDLLRSLDQERFEPFVLTYHSDTGYEDRLEEVGARVLSLDCPRTRKGRRKATPPGMPAGARTQGAWGHARRLARQEIPVALQIARVIREHGIELLHNNDNPRGDRPSILGARIAGIPQVSHIRYTPGYYRPLDRRLARWVHRFLPMSRAIREHFEGSLGRIRTPVEVVYDPFHFDVHDARLKASPVDRAAFGFGSGDYVLANVGRIVAWKGQDVFLRALRKAIDVCPDIKAIIAGEPRDGGDSEYWDHLQNLTEELNLHASVRFLGFRTDVPAIMLSADAVVHTATVPEPFGKVVVEAMASRRPVVASASGGPLEIVEEGRTGLLVAPSDPEALAQALIAMAADRSGSEAMGVEARSLAEQRYGVDGFRSTIARVFEDALKEGRGHPAESASTSRLDGELQSHG